ncbi:hypothetical protein MsAm2_15010 [Methanolapillus ohkumae]|uniref:Uncharacterized protein n=1 Tax=Methanolapillus ohkumae TaxID=3028298 RepID=A0AA96ZXH2_9EURY|nr:hypothetical protein MsAm2_15010 [Methanosarcinaceae archaeon Am2]
MKVGVKDIKYVALKTLNKCGVELNINRFNLKLNFRFGFLTLYNYASLLV